MLLKRVLSVILLGTLCVWDRDYGWGVRVRRPFGARGRSSVRYGTRLGDLQENWFLLFSNQTLKTHPVARRGGPQFLETIRAQAGPGQSTRWEHSCTARQGPRYRPPGQRGILDGGLRGYWGGFRPARRISPVRGLAVRWALPTYGDREYISYVENTFSNLPTQHPSSNLDTQASSYMLRWKSLFFFREATVRVQPGMIFIEHISTIL